MTLIQDHAKEAHETFHGLKVQYEYVVSEAQKAIIHTATLALHSESKIIFDTYPDLESFGWDQGTQWNDEYYVYNSGITDDEVFINGIDMRELEWDNPTEFERFAEYRKAVAHFLANLGEDNLRVLFGLGNRITVRRDGVYVEEGYYDKTPEDVPDWY